MSESRVFVWYLAHKLLNAECPEWAGLEQKATGEGGAVGKTTPAMGQRKNTDLKARVLSKETKEEDTDGVGPEGSYQSSLVRCECSRRLPVGLSF